MDTTTSEQVDQAGQLGAPPSPWLTVGEAAARARCGRKLIYREGLRQAPAGRSGRRTARAALPCRVD